ncbi:MAG: DUF2294 domain-containing protein [Deltaproteobacteria bacterium]|nr:DUF2294 domain-containing protein [Deltaproteobacteria bacterium]
MNGRSKGEIEGEVSKLIVQFEKEYMGRGPSEVRTHVVEDMVLVRLKGVLTRAEQKLISGQDGTELIKKLRATLLENTKEPLYEGIKSITNLEVITFHTDISTVSGEKVIIFTLSDDLEKKLRKF